MGNKLSFLAAVGPFTGGGIQDDGLSFPSNDYYHLIPPVRGGNSLGIWERLPGKENFGLTFSACVLPYENKST
jgi:hypothetical protein